MSEDLNNVIEMPITNNETQEISLFENRSKTFLANIKKADLLTPTLTEKITALAPELGHVFKTQTVWRTSTEIRLSVLNDMNFPDKASKYHQAKLEQLVFFEQLLYLSFEFRKLKQDLEVLEADAEEIEDKLTNDNLKSYEVKRLKAELEKKQIEIEEKSFGIQHHQIQARERIREIEIWSTIKTELDDGSFDKDNKDTNQLLSLAKRYIVEAFNAVHMGRNGDISSFNNITAQYKMLVQECMSRNLFKELMEPFGGPGNQMFDWVCRDFGIQIQTQPPVQPTWGQRIP